MPPRSASDKQAAKDAVASHLRAAGLKAAMARNCLTVRKDSYLCSRYISDGPTNDGGGSHWFSFSSSLARVVERMAQMRFLYQLHTAYEKVLLSIRHDAKSCGEYWDREETAAKAERRVLARRRFPDRWPWIPKTPWTPQTHCSYPMHVRERVKTVLLCLCRTTPLGTLDPSTQGALLEKIVGYLIDKAALSPRQIFELVRLGVVKC